MPKRRLQTLRAIGMAGEGVDGVGVVGGGNGDGEGVGFSAAVVVNEVGDELWKAWGRGGAGGGRGWA